MLPSSEVGAPFRAIGLGVKVFSRNFKFFLIITIAFFLPLGVFTALIPSSVTSDFASLFIALLPGEGGEAGLLDIPASSFYGAFVYLGLITSFSNLFAACASGAVMYIVLFDRRRAGGEDIRPTIAGMLESTAGRAHKYFITASMLSILQIVGAFVLVVPSVYVTVAFPFLAAVTADTGEWGVKAFSASFRLTRRRWWKTAWFLFVCGAAQLAISLLLSANGSIAFQVVYSMFVQLICLPVTAAVSLLYYDRAYPTAINIS